MRIGVEDFHLVSALPEHGRDDAEACGKVVGRLVQSAAMAALASTNHVIDTVNLNNNAKNYLEAGFTNLNLNYIASETNFMMVDTGTDAVSVASILHYEIESIKTIKSKMIENGIEVRYEN